MGTKSATSWHPVELSYATMQYCKGYQIWARMLDGEGLVFIAVVETKTPDYYDDGYADIAEALTAVGMKP